MRRSAALMGLLMLTACSADRGRITAADNETCAGYGFKPGTDAFAKRYPKAVVRNFDGKAGAPTEMDALVAYLQMLGTLVDFKLYNEKANLR